MEDINLRINKYRQKELKKWNHIVRGRKNESAITGQAKYNYLDTIRKLTKTVQSSRQ